MNSTDLYDRDTGALSAAGMAVLAGVSEESVDSLPTIDGRTYFPDTLISRVHQSVERAERAGLHHLDVYAFIDLLAAGEPTTKTKETN